MKKNTIDRSGVGRHLAEEQERRILERMCPGPVDLTEIPISEGVLIPTPAPLGYCPKVDYADDDLEHKRPVLVIEDPELNIHAWGYSRDELIEDIKVNFDMVWYGYAMFEGEMTQAAIELKKALRQRFRFVGIM